MKGKERAALRSQANSIQAIQQIGHCGVTEEIIRNTDMALDARELIKISVLETCPVGAKEAAETLASATGAEIIQVIGRKLVLYRVNPEKHK